MKKQIISTTKNYEPSTVDELLLDDTPKVNSFNFVTSDGIARAISGASGEVPVVTEGDDGKILTAVYDAGGPAVEWADAPSGIPDMTGKNGKILGAVDNDGTMEAQWINKPESNVTTTDKAFTVGVNGTGAPIAVNCTEASETYVETPYLLDNPEYATLISSGQLSPVLAFQKPEGMAENNITGTITITLAHDIVFNVTRFVLTSSFLYLADKNSDGYYPAYWNTPINNLFQNYTLKAGSYTLTFPNDDPQTHSYGVGIWFQLNGHEEDVPIVKETLAANASEFSISFTERSVTGYSIKPSVIATPGSDDAGKVLTVTDTQGNYGWQPVPQELPTLTGQAGKVLTVNSGATGTEWTNFTQIEVVSSMPASPTSGVLYIVTGA